MLIDSHIIRIYSDHFKINVLNEVIKQVIQRIICDYCITKKFQQNIYHCFTGILQMYYNKYLLNFKINIQLRGVLYYYGLSVSYH